MKRYYSMGFMICLLGAYISVVPAKVQPCRSESDITLTLKELHNGTGDTFWLLSGSTAYAIDQWIDTASASEGSIYKKAQEKNLNLYTLSGGKQLQLYQRITFEPQGTNSIGFLLYNKRTKEQTAISFDLRICNNAYQLTVTLGNAHESTAVLSKALTVPLGKAALNVTIAIEHGTPGYSICVDGTIAVQL